VNFVKSIEGLTVGQIAPDSIVNADCLEAMKLMPDKSIDSIIADLPYGPTNCHWDLVIPFDLLWEQYKRIIKPNGAIVLFGSQPFTSALVMCNPKWFKIKPNGGIEPCQTSSPYADRSEPSYYSS
jgi:site-specific DNA-methyltransferase (adenine-specific)